MVMPLVALLAFTVKLLQIFAYSARDIFVGSSNAGRLWSTVAIELLFTLAWTGVVFQIYLLALAPETFRDKTSGRTGRAVLYAFAFWAISFALTIGGIFWIATLRGPGRQVVTIIFVYLPYIFIVASALTRPAIAIGLPKPFRECRRIVQENWFGIAVTLGLAALPLGLLFFSVGLTRQFLHLGVGPALLLEVPIAMVSTLFYAAFEGAIAEMYKRIG
jgi:hypothetical protein